LSYRRNYKEGIKQGLWEEFDEGGNLTRTEEYKDGVLQK
jgi:antitoxin component YwqK of YwqJK toxin-antitoxin module|tara:strand:- start:325 stop:441 length:117 start_codon:yes stop_codon:yes gene_type:complete